MRDAGSGSLTADAPIGGSPSLGWLSRHLTGIAITCQDMQDAEQQHPATPPPLTLEKGRAVSVENHPKTHEKGSWGRFCLFFVFCKHLRLLTCWDPRSAYLRDQTGRAGSGETWMKALGGRWPLLRKRRKSGQKYQVWGRGEGPPFQIRGPCRPACARPGLVWRQGQQGACGSALCWLPGGRRPSPPSCRCTWSFSPARLHPSAGRSWPQLGSRGRVPNLSAAGC